MKSILASAAERKAQKPDVPAERPQFGMCLVSPKNPPHEQALQDSELPEILPERAKEECRSEIGWLSLLSLLTRSGAQQEDEDGLLTEVVNGEVSPLQQNHPATHSCSLFKHATCMFLKSHLCSSRLTSFFIVSLLAWTKAKSSCLHSHFIAFNAFILSQLNLV